MVKIKITKAGDFCRKCSKRVIYKKSPFKPSKLKKNYYYKGYLYCENCKEMYMLESEKVIRGTNEWNEAAKGNVVPENQASLF